MFEVIPADICHMRLGAAAQWGVEPLSLSAGGLWQAVAIPEVLYYVYRFQAVLPDYKWDVASVCAAQRNDQILSESRHAAMSGCFWV